MSASEETPLLFVDTDTQDEYEDSSRRQSILSPPSSAQSVSMRRASEELLGLGHRRSRNSFVDVRPKLEQVILMDDEDSVVEELTFGISEEDEWMQQEEVDETDHFWRNRDYWRNRLQSGLALVPPVLVTCLLNILLSVPFGVSYFPIGWHGASEVSNNAADEDGIHGEFPIPGKEALGIRMFLFSSIVGQVVFTFASKFNNPICVQMVENVPFCHALAYNVIREQGYGVEALSTLFFLFGLSSVLVGAFFYSLGKMELGKVVYFFPSHVLIGCIGGIGVFLVITAIEVTNNVTFSFTMDGIQGVVDKFDHLRIVLMFEVTIRFLAWATTDRNGAPRFPLLSPTFYCLITPIFYLGLVVFGVSVEEATEAGYFFPPAEDPCDPASAVCSGVSFWGSIWNEHLFDIWRVIDLRTVSWTAVFNSIGTMAALAAFSLVHVPINIPAFSISTDVDTDMNAELIAHGYANALVGVFGGLQNYMTYSNSVLYAKSGGKGKIASLAVAFITAGLFVVGPAIATYMPRCMAGSLILHIGIDLFLEGVFDSYGSYDVLEYAGIWLITIVMTTLGMTAALIAGIVSALSTYAVQSITYQNPVRGTMTASSLRSSTWNRCAKSLAILDDEFDGRNRVLVVQLQGHLFFGNVALLTDTVKDLLHKKRAAGESPHVVILDFTLVVGMDSSAAHGIAKLRGIMHRLFHVEVSVFVTGPDRGGFPCEFALSQALSSSEDEDVVLELNKTEGNGKPGQGRGSVTVSAPSASKLNIKLCGYPYDKVCGALDEALAFAEDILIARQDPSLLEGRPGLCDAISQPVDVKEETKLGISFLKNLCGGSDSDDALQEEVEYLFSRFQREVYSKHQIVWSQGSPSDCAKLLVFGELRAHIRGTTTSECVSAGNLVGELGLVHGNKRLSTLECASDTAILYTLSSDSWNEITRTRLDVAKILYDIVVRYLAQRCQHVSNRIYETRCLPV